MTQYLFATKMVISRTQHTTWRFLLIILAIFATFNSLSSEAQHITSLHEVKGVTFSSPTAQLSTNFLQPYGDRLDVAFSTFGIDFEFNNMELDATSVENTSIEVHNNGILEHLYMPQTTFRSDYIDSLGNKAYAIVTINPETNDILAVVHQDNDMYYIHPKQSITPMLKNGMLQGIKNLSSIESNTVSFKASELQYLDESGQSLTQCQSLEIDSNSSENGHKTDIDLDFLLDPLHMKHIVKDAIENGNMQIDLHNRNDQDDQYNQDEEYPMMTSPSSTFERELNLVRWANCLPNDQIVRYTLVVNVHVDVGFYNLFTGVADLNSFIQNTFSYMDDIFNTQMGFKLSLGKLIMNQSLNGQRFNNLGKYEANSGCSATSNYSINNYLDDFTLWVLSDATPLAHKGQWHALTNCYPPAGVVGLAYLNAVCSTKVRTGVSSYTNVSTRDVIIHELGHNLGSSHAWQYTNAPQGQTGGCMDYNVGCRLRTDDPDGPGENGFHRGSLVPICTHLSKTLNSEAHGTLSDISVCWQSQKLKSNVTYKWELLNDWGQCTSTHPCRAGTRSRKFACTASTGVVGLNRDCNEAEKQPEEETCYLAGECKSTWVVGEWNSCPSTDPCTYKNQSRSVDCRDELNAYSSKCDADTKPSKTQQCYGAGTCIPELLTLTTDKTSYEGGRKISLNWTYKDKSLYNTPPLASTTTAAISLRKASDPKMIVVIGIKLVSSSSLSNITLPTTPPAGSDYYIVVSATGFKEVRSSPIILSVDCSMLNCKNGSICDSQSSKCKCLSGYSGLDCSITKCTGIQCMNGGTCSFDTGKCICKEGWSGPTCGTVDTCTVDFDIKRCGDRGFLAKTSNICNKDCTCLNKWVTSPDAFTDKNSTKSQCNECPLVCNAGKPDNNCKLCDCPLGTHGQKCSCRHLDVKFRLKLSDWMNDSANVGRLNTFLESIKYEIITLTSINQSLITILPVSIDTTTQLITVNYRFLSTVPCTDPVILDPFIVSDSFVSSTPTHTLPLNLGQDEPGMKDAYDAAKVLAEIFKNLNIASYNTAFIITNEVVFTAGLDLVDTQCTSDCPSSVLPVDEPKKNGLSTGAIIGIAVGCAVVVIAIILAVIFLCRRSNSSQKPSYDNKNDVQLSETNKPPMHVQNAPPAPVFVQVSTHSAPPAPPVPVLSSSNTAAPPPPPRR